jgi:hypothetical protein
VGASAGVPVLPKSTLSEHSVSVGLANGQPLKKLLGYLPLVQCKPPCSVPAFSLSC